MSATNPQIEFPCRGVPQDAGLARLIGLYPQRQDGPQSAPTCRACGPLWMQRLKALGGRLSAGQWRALAEIVGYLTPDTPLHLTTRQDVELHDLPAQAVPEAHRLLAAGGMTGLGACGDTLRNITVCPCSGALAGSVDLFPLAWDVRNALESQAGIFALPRKFKMAFCCSQACGQPWINDLAFLARREATGWGFRVIGAGSLGAAPATGIELLDRLPPGDAVPLALAAVRLFAAHGDREHRSRARLRHVRQRVGDGEFLAMLQETFAAVKAEREWASQDVRQAGPQLPASLPMTFANGDVTPDAARDLADLIERDGLEVRIANNHQVVAFGRSQAEIRRALASSGPLAAAAAPQPAVVACPGAHWCSRALTDTNRLADALRDRLRGHALSGLTVCISGCPNGCAHSRVADVGLVGVRATLDGQSTDAYDLFAHGGMGRTPDLSQPVARKLSAGQAISEVAKLAEQFGESQAAGRHRAD